MLVIDDLDPAMLPQRKSKNDKVDLVSRSHEADDVWVRHNEAQDRTMSAKGKIFLGIETEYKENELEKPRNGNKNSTVTMWSMRCFFGESMCQLFLC